VAISSDPVGGSDGYDGDDAEHVSLVRREKSNFLLAFSVFLFTLGMVACLSKDIPFVNYQVPLEQRALITFIPALLFFLASGYLRVVQLKELLKLIPFKVVPK
jgi:hypothetical protein